jgi:class 3 adenylate cyclase
MTSTNSVPDDPTLPIARLEQDIEHRFAGLRRLLEITDRINPGVLLDEAFRQIDDCCRTSIPHERIEFVLLGDGGKTLVRRWLRNAAPADAPMDDSHLPETMEEALSGSLLNDLLAQNQPQVVKNLPALLAAASSSVFLRSAAAAGMRCCLIAPLWASGQSLGLALFSSADPNAYDARHLEFAQRISASMSAVIAKGKLYEMVIQAQLESERLLRNVLPEPIVKRLKAGEQVIADGFPEATVVFVDIVNFVNLSASMSPSAVIIVLNRIFSAFDALCEQYGVEKIKTIGDAYMLATGVPKPFPEHVIVAAKIALDMQELGKRLGTREEKALNFRIGIHTGPVVAGVIGTRKFSYDLWGDTVNIASRMESHGVPGRIHVSRAVYERLKNDFEFEARGLTTLKGVGEMESWFLLGPKTGQAYRSMVWSMLDNSVGEEPERQRRSEDT